jgi:uncharacterized protein YjbI with pentapeptide repeats
MADEQHLKMLNPVLNDWEERRESNPDIIPDLSGADLFGTDLSSAYLIGANFTGADLSNATIERAGPVARHYEA